MLSIKLFIAMATTGFGIWATLAPRKILALVGLVAQDGRGLSEARVALGAIYIGAGSACLLLQVPAAFATLGLAYLAMAVVRLLAIFKDHASDRSNWASLVLEAVMGSLLLI